MSSIIGGMIMAVIGMLIFSHDFSYLELFGLNLYVIGVCRFVQGVDGWMGRENENLSR